MSAEHVRRQAPTGPGEASIGTKQPPPKLGKKKADLLVLSYFCFFGREGLLFLGFLKPLPVPLSPYLENESHRTPFLWLVCRCSELMPVNASNCVRGLHTSATSRF